MRDFLLRHRYDGFWVGVSLAAIIYLFLWFTPAQLWYGITHVGPIVRH